MARGDVGYTVSNVGGEVEILNRKEFEAVPMTINFGAVTTPIPAGTPIKADGTTVAATPWTGAIGILLHDVDPLYARIHSRSMPSFFSAGKNCSPRYGTRLLAISSRWRAME